MSIFTKKVCFMGLIGLLVTSLMACGGGESTDEAKAQTADTGSLAFKIVYEIDPDLGPDRQSLAFSSCREINKVTAQVFDGTGVELSALHSFDCDARQGTIKDVSSGIDRQVIVRGVWMDENGLETVFYEGTATGVTINPGKTTLVDALVARFKAPEDPEQLEALLSLADQDNDGYTQSDGDCDDTDPDRYPGADERCNMVDDNCNGKDDEPYKTFYIDNDGDGFGTEVQTMQGCTAPEGWAEKKTEGMDCDDTRSDVYPGATEVLCDGLDNDCDGEKICDKPEGTYYRDSDGDGFGDQMQSRQGPAEGYVDNDADCDDTNKKINPDAEELCNGNDDNCDGHVDEGLMRAYHPDDDKDGYGDSNQTTMACAPSTGYLLDGSDCDDAKPDIHPGVDETWNDIDDNCDGKIDEGWPWNRLYSGGDVTQAESIIPGNTGGYIISGGTSPSDDNLLDGWIIKIDEDGNELWNRTFGGASYDQFYSGTQGNTGGYVMAGHIFSYEEGSDAWVIKINENGDVLWNRTFGGTGSDILNSVIQSNTGGYVIAGNTSSYGSGGIDGWVIKIDEDGNELWKQTFGGTEYDSLNSVIQGNTSGYVIAGNSNLYGSANYDGWVIKIDEDGNELWKQTFGGTEYDSLNSVIQGNTGVYVIAGQRSGDVAWIIKIDENGNELWNQTFGSAGSGSLNSVIQSNTGGYVVAGVTGSYRYYGGNDAWIFKIDENGNRIWDRIFGGTESDYFNSVIKGDTGGYVVAGYTSSYGEENNAGWSIRIDEKGEAPASP